MIGILLISTRRYKQFVKPLLEQIDKYFLPNEELTVFLFNDEGFNYNEGDYDFVLRQFKIPPYPFPEATLFRYKIFNAHSEEMKDCSHLFYLDADSGIVGTVGKEILVDGLMAVRHPGFYASDLWGSEGNPENSTSYFPASKRKHYYCGGTQGGKSEHYLEACKILRGRIDEDDDNDVRAIHNDETHWNKWCNVDRPELVTEFTPSYCMVEEMPLRQRWGIADLEIKIIALAKNHAEIRS